MAKDLKDVILAVRITSELKADLEIMAEIEHRTVSNVVTMILKEYFNAKAKSKKAE